MIKGGGINIDNYKRNLREAIITKIKKKSGYNKISQDKFGLAILFTEIVPLEVKDNLFLMTKEILEGENKIKFIYYISNYFCYYIDCINWKKEYITISKESSYGLKMIARMTADGKLKLEDEEWN